VQYDGTAYLGFASQDLEETVENHLFKALIKLKLIEDRKVRLAWVRYVTRTGTIF
jgi:tRNA U38,U39,U40 pseudouridine synthase TruA